MLFSFPTFLVCTQCAPQHFNVHLITVLQAFIRLHFTTHTHIFCRGVCVYMHIHMYVYSCKSTFASVCSACALKLNAMESHASNMQKSTHIHTPARIHSCFVCILSCLLRGQLYSLERLPIGLCSFKMCASAYFCSLFTLVNAFLCL